MAESHCLVDDALEEFAVCASLESGNQFAQQMAGEDQVLLHCCGFCVGAQVEQQLCYFGGHLVGQCRFRQQVEQMAVGEQTGGSLKRQPDGVAGVGF